MSTAEFDNKLAIAEIKWSSSKKGKSLIQYLTKTFTRKPASVKCRSARLQSFEQVFGHPAFSNREERTMILRKVTEEHFSEETGSDFLGDLSGERIICWGEETTVPVEDVMNDYNLWLVKRLVRHASAVQIEMTGHSRRVIQTARLRGLICSISFPQDHSFADRCQLTVSGPAAILFKTKMYGEALASVVGLLPWCESFTLRASCMKHTEAYTLRVSSLDPIRPAKKPRAYDSHLEERFAREFLRKISDLRLIREPTPLPVGSKWIFPDFLITDARERVPNTFCEIIGWWTEEYLHQKCLDWSNVSEHRFILCVREDLGPRINNSEFKGKLVYFKNRLDPEKVRQAFFS